MPFFCSPYWITGQIQLNWVWLVLGQKTTLRKCSLCLLGTNAGQYLLNTLIFFWTRISTFFSLSANVGTHSLISFIQSIKPAIKPHKIWMLQFILFLTQFLLTLTDLTFGLFHSTLHAYKLCGTLKELCNSMAMAEILVRNIWVFQFVRTMFPTRGMQ